MELLLAQNTVQLPDTAKPAGLGDTGIMGTDGELRWIVQFVEMQEQVMGAFEVMGERGILSDGSPSSPTLSPASPICSGLGDAAKPLDLTQEDQAPSEADLEEPVGGALPPSGAAPAGDRQEQEEPKGPMAEDAKVKAGAEADQAQADDEERNAADEPSGEKQESEAIGAKLPEEGEIKPGGGAGDALAAVWTPALVSAMEAAYGGEPAARAEVIKAPSAVVDEDLATKVVDAVVRHPLAGEVDEADELN